MFFFIMQLIYVLWENILFLLFLYIKERKTFYCVGNESIDFSENPPFVPVLTFWNSPSTFEKCSVFKSLHYSCRVKEPLYLQTSLSCNIFYLPGESGGRL